MPRKSRHHYYEDEDDDYYDYDDDYDNDYDTRNDALESHNVEKFEDSMKQIEVWQCSMCTYNNPTNHYLCDMCGVHRNVPPNDASEASMAISESKVWSCSACTYVNMKDASFCEICGTPKSSSNDGMQPMVPSTAVSASNTSKINSSRVRVHGDKCGETKAENGLNKDSENELKSNKLQNANSDTNHNWNKSVKGSKRVVSPHDYVPESWVVDLQRKKGKHLLHLAIVGHVDAGKSTLTGRFLHLMGRVSQKEMHKYEKEAKQMGKESFAYAWVLDESSEERQRGVTMTVAVAHFDTDKFHVVLLDSPGHKDFVPNMIMGTSQADAAVLVVDASMGAFESGMDGQGTGGQTKEHAQLVRSFGVEQLIIAVNKMDAVKYSKERFDTIKSQLGQFLRRCGFKEASLTWIPMSVIENQNIVTRTTDARLKSWYAGPHFLEAIDLFKPPTRDISRPLRMPISEVIQSRTVGQIGASGKVESGAVKVGTKVLVMPSKEEAIVKAIEQDGKALNVAVAGDSIDIGLQGIDGSTLIAGGVLCHPEFPVPVAIRIELKVAILDIKSPILCGTEVELHAHHAKEAARIVCISAILDSKTGSIKKKAPRLLTAHQSALIEVCPNRVICVEEYSNCRPLGRVTLRSTGRTVAVGVVMRITEQ